MSDTGLRRLLERATAEPPADLEARVFRARRHPWRWTAAAAAVVLVAGVVGWSLARESRDEVGLVSEPPSAQFAIRPIGETGFVATWLPGGFEETSRDAKSTTWSNSEGDSITVGIGRELQVPKIGTEAEPLGPGYAAERGAASGRQWLVWCNGESCSVETSGVSRLDAVRVAVGLAARDRLRPRSETGDTEVPNLVGQWSRFIDSAGFRVHLVFRTDRSDREEYVVEQHPAAGTQAARGSTITLEVGAQARYPGFEPVRSNGHLVGWMDERFADIEGPKPVVSFVKEERLQGYLIPGEGFVWIDELFDRRDRDVPRTVDVYAPGARGLAIAHGSLWVARGDANGAWLLERRDLVTGMLSVSIDIPGVVRGVVAGKDVVAVYGGGDGAYPEGGVAIIDPSSNTVIGTYGWDGGVIVSPYFGVATDEAIWVTDAVRNQVVRFRRNGSGAIEMRRYPVSGQPTMIAAMPDGSVWVQRSLAGKIVHLDGQSGSVLANVDLPGFLAADGTALWSTDGERTVEFDTVVLVQGALSAAQGARLPVRAGALAVDADGVWLAPFEGGLQRWLRTDFEDAAPQPRAMLGPGTGAAPWSLAAIDGSLWFVTLDGLTRWTPSADDLAKAPD
jgi:hypothetical protein